MTPRDLLVKTFRALYINLDAGQQCDSWGTGQTRRGFCVPGHGLFNSFIMYSTSCHTKWDDGNEDPFLLFFLYSSDDAGYKGLQRVLSGVNCFLFPTHGILMYFLFEKKIDSFFLLKGYLWR